MALDDLTGFSGQVPVFPLPNVVMMPHTFLPLHIFEPRYREMTADALAGERLIAMALLQPGYEKVYEGNPPIHDVVCVGRIVQEAKLSDGRYNMLLFGVSRARIVEVVNPLPYRTAEVELLEDGAEDGAGDAFRRELAGIYADVAANLGEDPKAVLEKIMRPEVRLGFLTDIVAAVLNLDVAIKQGLLEDLDPASRARKVIGAAKALERARRRRFNPPSLN